MESSRKSRQGGSRRRNSRTFTIDGRRRMKPLPRRFSRAWILYPAISNQQQRWRANQIKAEAAALKKRASELRHLDGGMVEMVQDRYKVPQVRHNAADRHTQYGVIPASGKSSVQFYQLSIFEGSRSRPLEVR
jgi:hypothetical protein